MNLDEYDTAFSIADIQRDSEGSLTVRLHTDGSSLVWGVEAHRQLPELFEAISSDPDNRVVVLTGTGSHFITTQTGAYGGSSASRWEQIVREGERLVTRHLQIPVPVIVAMNGPVSVHSEIAVLGDIVLCSDNSYFEDAVHVRMGIAPGDGVQVIWPMLLGPNRGRHFLLTGARITPDEALSLGVIAEVLPAERLMPRAREVAAELAQIDPAVMRSTRYVLTRPLLRAVTEDVRTGLAVEALSALARNDHGPN